MNIDVKKLEEDDGYGFEFPYLRRLVQNLVCMVCQHCNKSEDGFYFDDYLSANESSFETLVKLGIAEFDESELYIKIKEDHPIVRSM